MGRLWLSLSENIPSSSGDSGDSLALAHDYAYTTSGRQPEAMADNQDSMLSWGSGSQLPCLLVMGSRGPWILISSSCVFLSPWRMVGHSFSPFLLIPFAHTPPFQRLLLATSTTTSTCLWWKHTLTCAGGASVTNSGDQLSQQLR